MMKKNLEQEIQGYRSELAKQEQVCVGHRWMLVSLPWMQDSAGGFLASLACTIHLHAQGNSLN
jgi:hypothetical protein